MSDPIQITEAMDMLLAFRDGTVTFDEYPDRDVWRWVNRVGRETSAAILGEELSRKLGLTPFPNGDAVWLDVYQRRSFHPVGWESLTTDQQVWYYLKRSKPGEREAHGPFVVDKEQGTLRNGQGVALPFTRFENSVQLVLPDSDRLAPY